MLAGNFYIGKHNSTQAIHARHQSRSIALVGGIKVQNISAASPHCHIDAWGGPAMGEGQTGDEFSPQAFYL